MPLRLRCACGQKMSMPERKAGKTGRCPQCGTSFKVPLPGTPEYDAALAQGAKPSGSGAVDALMPAESAPPETAPAPAPAPPVGGPPVPFVPAPAAGLPPLRRLAPAMLGTPSKIALPSPMPPTHGKPHAGPRGGGAPPPPGAARVPAAPPEDLFGPEPEAAAARPCPACGRLYSAATTHCVTCGIDLGTGAPSPADPPAGPGIPRLAADPRSVARPWEAAPASAPAGSPFVPASPGGRRAAASTAGSRADAAEIGFFRLLLLTIFRPATALDGMTWHLARPDMLLKMAGLFLVSLVAVAACAVYGPDRSDPDRAAGGSGARAEGGAGPGLFDGTATPHFTPGPGRSLGLLTCDFALEPDPPRPHAAAILRYVFLDTRTAAPFAKKVSARVESAGAPDGEGGGGEEEGEEDAAGGSAFDGLTERGPKPGEYLIRAALGSPGRYHVAFRIEQGGELPDMNLEHTFDVPAPAAAVTPGSAGAPAGGPASGAAADRALLAFLVVADLLVNVAVLLLQALAVNVAARLFGGGGGVIPMFVVLAFLTGVINLLRLALLVVGALAGETAAIWLGKGLDLWQCVLFFLALMKVYDLEVSSALAASTLAGLIQFWAKAALLAAFVGWLVARGS
ncbi:MAG: hypothetical protein HZA54_18435 [Planctomycetes bacterium]|nr:hypothetical protein [Planctomycetota bacterium]